MTEFRMPGRRQCRLELPGRFSGIIRRFVERTQENEYRLQTNCDQGLLFLSEDEEKLNEYRSYSGFNGLGAEIDAGYFSDDVQRNISYCFFPSVFEVSKLNVQERRDWLFGGRNERDGFVLLLESLKKASEAFADYRLETLYARHKSLIVVPIVLADQKNCEEDYDPFYRLGVVVLNFLYENKLQFVADRSTIDDLRGRLKADNNFYEIYRNVLLRMTEERAEARFAADIDVIELCKSEAPIQCVYDKRNDGVICRNGGDDVHIQVFSFGADKRARWEKLQGKLAPVCELPEELDVDQETDRDEDGYIWRADEGRGNATQTIAPVSFHSNRNGAGLWGRVGPIFQFSSLPDAILGENDGRFALVLDKQKLLTFYLYWPRDIPRCRLTVRADRFANYPNEEGNLRDEQFVCSHNPQACKVDLKELKFPLYFRIFSETFPNEAGESSFSLSENCRSRFVIESEEQLKGNSVCLAKTK